VWTRQGIPCDLVRKPLVLQLNRPSNTVGNSFDGDSIRVRYFWGMAFLVLRFWSSGTRRMGGRRCIRLVLL
jgi:hypothetical protein